ncbi:hypothetical protein YC2023_015949 [Brassica napus]
MATSNDGSSSGEDREATEVTPASFPVTPTPLQPASIETIMARLAQQDAAQKAAKDQIAALAKILAPLAANTANQDLADDDVAQTPVSLDAQTINELAALKQSVLDINSKIHHVTTSAPQIERVLAESLQTPFTEKITTFLGKEDFELTTKRTYGSILSNLTYVKTFASGILIPKSYILPLDDKQYLLPPTSLVQDAHKAGLQVYVSGFSNDVNIAYNYSSDPVSEYLSFVDNGDFSVGGILSDFPVTASASIDLAYKKAIEDGADVIDCLVQMSSDGKPFCSSSIDLTQGTMVIQSPFRNGSAIIPEISSNAGIYTFSLTWPEVQSLTRKFPHLADS